MRCPFASIGANGITYAQADGTRQNARRDHLAGRHFSVFGTRFVVDFCTFGTFTDQLVELRSAAVEVRRAFSMCR